MFVCDENAEGGCDGSENGKSNDDVEDDVDVTAEDNCDAYESIANIQPARYVMQDLPSAYNYNCHIVNNSVLHTFSGVNF